MRSGEYTVRALRCRSCGGYLGWHVVSAHSEAGRWMEGCTMLELTCVEDRNRRDRLEAVRRQETLRRRERPVSRASVRDGGEKRRLTRWAFSGVFRKMNARRRSDSSGCEGPSGMMHGRPESPTARESVRRRQIEPLPDDLAPRNPWSLCVRRSPVQASNFQDQQVF
ncbi:hypothetical protein K488DRAFT_72850 [Vararia minispora EC-137]|uniref:Uncharacterized protein n=1 Tax=Vararia minispora EC-137 TaxID=1314806 RepID=A0ACB8QD67_9AGAM|nr:hypothetical protein K488DRAFT_72850 [Vararia minispora EC-137]